MVSLGTKWYFE